jgi:hypothetical protein
MGDKRLWHVGKIAINLVVGLSLSMVAPYEDNLGSVL